MHRNHPRPSQHRHLQSIRFFPSAPADTALDLGVTRVDLGPAALVALTAASLAAWKRFTYEPGLDLNFVPMAKVTDFAGTGGTRLPPSCRKYELSRST